MERETKIRNDGDLLSYIPYSLGFLPQQSVVIMALYGGNLELMARFDVRAEILALSRERLQGFVEHVHSVFHGATPICADAEYAVVFYLKGEERVEELRLAFHDVFSPDCEHSEDTCRILTMLHVREHEWCVLFADGSTSELRTLHAGVDAHSAVSADMVFNGQTYAPSIGSLTDQLLNTVPPVEPAGLEAELDRVLGEPVPDRWDHDFLASAIGAWEHALSRLTRRGQSAFDPAAFNPRAALELITDMDAAEVAALYASLRSLQVRDALLVLCFFGQHVAEATSRMVNTPQIVLAAQMLSEGQVLANGEHDSLVELENAEEIDGFTPEERTLAVLAHGRAMDLYDQIFTGHGLGTTESFHEDAELRIASCMLLLKSLLTLPSQKCDPAILTLLAWDSWRRGKGSVAGHYVDHALALDSTYNLARIQVQMIERGITFDRQTYRPPQEADRWAS